MEPTDQSLHRFFRGFAADAAPWRHLPEDFCVRRAREYHLYDQNGIRYVDFWQHNGSVLLGHRVSGVNRAVKDQLDRGPLVPSPNQWFNRASKQLPRAIAEIGFADCRATACRTI